MHISLIEIMDNINVNWTASMIKCERQNEYMFGNVTLNNADQDCQRISPKHTSPSWIGVARQSYVSEDKGKVLAIIQSW
ncbi:hypothetical protein MHBO_003879 [Bonamia ostreae]|uniref:Uncharacterized protein n=1 Tax=Bonamia ostreae TaxID=126728 RepID=A0ABV2ASM1_9EUKA